MKHFTVSNLKVELAQDIVKSELLVSEDEDFINNFILSEDTLEEYKKAGESGGSVLGDVLLFSGSLAAVAGKHFSVLFQRIQTNCRRSVLPQRANPLGSDGSSDLAIGARHRVLRQDWRKVSVLINNTSQLS